METANNIRGILNGEWLPNIYRDKVRTQRTRAFTLGIESREHKVEIQHTLLGIELKVGNKRINCPDLSTARYLQVFARFGCNEIAIPYDITKISTLADELESSWQRFVLILNQQTEEKNAATRGKIRSKILKEIRQELTEIGAGELMPEFNQNTKQRKS